MSNACTVLEFQKLYQTHLAAFSLADQWQRGDALNKMLESLRRLHYLTLTRSNVTPRNHPMVEIRGQFSLAKRLPELVQIDLANLWAQLTGSASHAFHTFHRTQSGFDGVFLAVVDGAVVTYLVQIESRE